MYVYMYKPPKVLPVLVQSYRIEGKKQSVSTNDSRERETEKAKERKRDSTSTLSNSRKIA